MLMVGVRSINTHSACVSSLSRCLCCVCMCVDGGRGGKPHAKRNVVCVMLTMVSVVLTCFRGKYIDFQLKMLFGKRVSVFRGGAQPHAKRNVVCVLLTMVSVVLTCFRGKYIDFQLKMLYGKR